jgi:hypothetical protein
MKHAEAIQHLKKHIAAAGATKGTKLVVNWPGQGYMGLVTLPQAGNVVVTHEAPQFSGEGSGELYLWDGISPNPTEIPVGTFSYPVGDNYYLYYQLTGPLVNMVFSWLYA